MAVAWSQLSNHIWHQRQSLFSTDISSLSCTTAPNCWYSLSRASCCIGNTWGMTRHLAQLVCTLLWSQRPYDRCIPSTSCSFCVCWNFARVCTDHWYLSVSQNYFWWFCHIHYEQTFNFPEIHFSRPFATYISFVQAYRHGGRSMLTNYCLLSMDAWLHHLFWSMSVRFWASYSDSLSYRRQRRLMRACASAVRTHEVWQ